ncbi:hypothetical protein SAMN02746066_01759 [Anaerosporobacter mobilis DSM 15930]|jgi:hypothetical protein|uniref:Uncharacterized protein n=1 Tax=Anaerosporobacter mobilis DSM 15930 TaxID=1120996 RepID=A0A1M7IAX5_9FIRM|nr:hypothetical protein [Anaerosporobacter mobilis]SHM37743.1 hypothetical protein SAMN02746066_01759 [Anaerosporobacter mobilis DSM 15930]
MDREKLIDQVKDEYARIASSASQENHIQSTTKLTPEAYYEKLLSKAIDEINQGTFDDFKSGEQIVSAIANDKTLISN